MASKPCKVAVVAFICLYVISESRSGGYGNGGDYYPGVPPYSGYGDSSWIEESFYERGVDPRLQQESVVDDLGFYDVNIQRYGKAVNVVASLVEISFFLVMFAGIIKKLTTLHNSTSSG